MKGFCNGWILKSELRQISETTKMRRRFHTPTMFVSVLASAGAMHHDDFDSDFARAVVVRWFIRRERL
tara:strand:- start:60 stop:263 length:204 start_codon:yes stop_codon:yes gene_type:complete